MKIRWPKAHWVGGGGGAYLKLNLNTRYIALEGQTSHFDAYALSVRSD